MTLPSSQPYPTGWTLDKAIYIIIPARPGLMFYILFFIAGGTPGYQDCHLKISFLKNSFLLLLVKSK